MRLGPGDGQGRGDRRRRSLNGTRWPNVHACTARPIGSCDLRAWVDTLLLTVARQIRVSRAAALEDGVVGYRNLREPGNAEVPWDKFDSAAYFAHNYAELRADDAEIIRVVAGFFDRYGAYRERERAIDVGPGTNLYPALTMLPFADT